MLGVKLGLFRGKETDLWKLTLKYDICTNADWKSGVFYFKAHDFLPCNIGRRLNNPLPEEISTII